ncbi:MAG: hypothetical protein WCO25_01780 [Candidatus Uhrbacteria bacterium]
MPTKKVVVPVKAAKTVAKKVVRRSVAARRPPARTSLPEPVYVMDLPKTSEPIMMEPEAVPEARATARVVYLAGCKNCNHIPLGVNMVVGVLVAIIFTLSAMLMASSVTVRGTASQITAYHRLLSSPVVAAARKIN